MGGDECIDFKNPIVRTFLSGNRIFAATGKSRLSVKPRPYMLNYPKILVVEKRERVPAPLSSDDLPQTYSSSSSFSGLDDQ